MKKYQKGGVTSPMKSNPKPITPLDNGKTPVKPTPPSYKMKKGGSVSKSKKK